MTAFAATARAVLTRTLTLSLVWWAMVEGDTSVLSYGLVLVPLAVLTSLALAQPGASPGRWGRRARATVGLVGWFAWQSVRGGTDVALRAVRRPVDLDVVERTYTWRTSAPRVRVTVAALSGLMPGTLTIDMDEHALLVHVLHRSLDTDAQIGELERRVAAALGHAD